MPDAGRTQPGSGRLIAVLTGAAGAGSLASDVVSKIERRYAPTRLRILAPGDAAEFDLAAENGGELRELLAAHPVDVNVVSAHERRKRLLVADMDSTIIQQECIDEMADVFGLKARISAITERAMRGELQFEAALLERLGLLAGLDEPSLGRVFEERIRLMPGALDLVATMRMNGAYTALVSGGFTFYTSRVARTVGFDTNRANQLAFENGRLTGGVVGPILGREAKLAALRELAAMRGLPLTATLAVGDGANDLDMVRAAGLGVAFRAKPAVAAEAAASIVHADLTALLYLQGYTAAEIAAARTA